MYYRSKWNWLLVAIFLVTSCNSTASTSTPVPTDFSLSSSPLPFEFVAAPPEGKFILIALGDDDYTCLDGLCDCPVVEAAAPPFGFSGEIFQLGPSYLFDDYTYADSLIGTNKWSALRKSSSAIGLFGVYSYSSTGDVYLAFITSFPYDRNQYGFVFLGVNSQGAIQLKTKDGYFIVFANQEFHTEMPELRSEGCKVLNKFTLKNYGFIDDSNVTFSYDYTNNYPPAVFPP